MKRKIKNIRLVNLCFAAGIVFLLTGILFQVLYQQSPEQPFNLKNFQDDIHLEMTKSDQLAKKIIRDSLYLNPEKLTGISNRAVYLFNNYSLIYWSTNAYEFSADNFMQDDEWHFIEGENAFLTGKWYQIDENTKMLIIIPIKSNYSLENQYLSNDFAPVFDLHQDIQLTKTNETSAIPVYDQNGTFLFGLLFKDKNIYNDNYGLAGFISFSLFFIFLIICYFVTGKKLLKKSKLNFAIFTSAIFILLLLLSYLNLPSVFFNNPLFSPWQMAVNSIISSYTHLTLILLFVFTVTLVYTAVENKSGYITGSVLLFLSIVLFFELLKSMILHAGISFNILSLNDLDFIHTWAHLLLFISGYIIFLQIRHWNFHLQSLKALSISAAIYLIIGLIISYFYNDNYNILYMIVMMVIYSILMKLLNIISENIRLFIFIVLMTLTTLFISFSLNENKKDIRFRILSENILINGNEENDPIAEMMIEEMHKNIREDAHIHHILLENDSVNPVKNYIFDKYLKGFWNIFDVEFYRISSNSDQFRQYRDFLEFSGKRIRETDFFSLPASLYDLSFVGIIPAQEPDSFQTVVKNDILLMEFKPKRNSRSYSFPDLLISGERSKSRQNEISVARFEKDELIYHDNRYDWEKTGNIFKNATEGFLKVSFKNDLFYVFSQGENKIVIKELHSPKIWAYFLYMLAVLMAYLLLWRIIAIGKMLLTPDMKFSL